MMRVSEGTHHRYLSVLMIGNHFNVVPLLSPIILNKKNPPQTGAGSDTGETSVKKN